MQQLADWEIAYRERERTRIHTEPKTGNQYTLATNHKDVPMHWSKKDPLAVSLYRNDKTEAPYVILCSTLGADADYTPDTLRALAATLLKIADDADAQPIPAPCSWASYRCYPV